VLELLSYRDIGLLAFCGVVGVCTLVSIKPLFWMKRDIGPMMIAFLLSFSFYMIPTQMHERYVLYCLPIVAFAARDEKKLWPVYIILSTGAFISLASTLRSVYRESMPMLAFLFPEGREEVYTVSVINVGIWVWLAITFIGSLRKPGILTSFAIAPLVLAVLISGIVSHFEGVPLSELRPEYAYQEWGTLQHNKSVGGRRLSVGGQTFEKGLGTHARSVIIFDLKGKYKLFEASVGIDDESVRDNLVCFIVMGDDSVLFFSDSIGYKPAPIPCVVSVKGIDKLQLIVDSGGDGIDYDHADWIEPRLFR
jgi:hypothetical protein